MVGWGYTDAADEHEVLPSILQELELRVVPAANCTEIYRKLLGENESLDPTDNGTISHPWPRDTGKYAAQGPNIMSPSAPMMPPSALEPTFNILESQICAEGLSFGRDSCNGDSGGPVMSLNSEFQYVARGVVSYGGQKCNSEYPGVYTRVSRYLGWIDSVINGQ